MGYPMSYDRVVNRHGLIGDYGDGYQVPPDLRLMRESVAGDLRRLERDQRDERHLALYAEAAGITPAQAKTVLDAFFAGDVGSRAMKARTAAETSTAPQEPAP